MTEKIRWSIIGAGGIADRRTIPAIMKDEGSELVAIMDRVPEVAKAVGEKYGVPYFTSEAEMLEAVESDAVYIGTPVFCHKEQALAALKYNRHVFIEKPVTISAKEAEELTAAFKAAGKQLTVGYMMKYHNLHEQARELVKAGKIGKPVSVRARFSCWYPDIPGAWRQNPALGGGGAFMDLGVHCAELIEYVLGDEISDVKAFCATNSFGYEVEDSASIIFKTKGGCLGGIDANFNIPDAASESRLEIFGDAGYVICSGTLAQTEGGKLTYLYAPQGDYQAMQDRVESEPIEALGADGNLYEKQIKIFCDLLRAGKTDYFYADRATHIQEIVEAIYADANK